jgi:hypothetical protein
MHHTSDFGNQLLGKKTRSIMKRYKELLGKKKSAGKSKDKSHKKSKDKSKKHKGKMSW